ncbi:MAG: D-alanyl-D-alanine carboxypeptidase family protein [Ruminococcus sp.]|nr:D-alanyl-D-alanine carboxypeptidase family protein [Ruminococcus sp.]
MKAKRIIASVLSFALCTGAFTSLNVSAEGILSARRTTESSNDNTATAPADTPSESVVTIKLGDLNGDNSIDATDASTVLSAYANASSGKDMGLSAAQMIAADVDKNGSINAVDASNILSYYAYRAVKGKRSLEEYLSDPAKAMEEIKVQAGTVTTSATAAAVSSTSTVTTATTTKMIPLTNPSTAVSTTAVTTTKPIPLTNPIIATSVTSTEAPKPVTSTTSAAPATSATTVLTTTTAAPVTTTTAAPTTTATTTTTAAPTTTTTTTTTTAVPTTTTVTTAPVTTTSTTVPVVTTTTTFQDPNKVAAIKLSKTEINLSVGGEGDISMVTMLPVTARDKTEQWSSSNENVATVNYEGWITPVGEGDCTITVKSLSNPKVFAEIKVNVTDPYKVREIVLSKNNITMPVGGEDISMVQMLPANAPNKEEVWVSSDEKIATVDSEGLIKGVAPGACTVTVYSRSNPEVHASIKVTITDPRQVSEIKLSKYEMDILVGTLDISYVTMLPETALDKTEIWISSDSNIAKVDKWGNVYGVSAGVCTITVISQSNNNVKADIKVTVHNKPVATTTTTKATTTTTTTTTTTATTTAATTTQPAVSTTVSPAEHLVMTRNGATYVDGILVVNKSYSVPKEFNAGGGLNANALTMFNKLSEEAALHGLNIVCSSGYRSYENQEKIYNNYVATDGMLKADTYSARPGHSEHQTGLAIDVNSISPDFADTPECAWLEKNAHKYGFIIRYPKGKEAITGFQYEPWHIRFLGVETATAVYNSGLCLEEYLVVTSYYN